MRFRYFPVFRIHKYSIHSVFIIFLNSLLLYTFLVISFARYKEHKIWQISFGKFSDVLPNFTCASAVGNFYCICLGLNILRCPAKSEGSNTSATRAKIPRLLVLSIGCNGNTSLLKAFRTISLSSKSVFRLSRVSLSCFFWLKLLGFVSLLRNHQFQSINYLVLYQHYLK